MPASTNRKPSDRKIRTYLRTVVHGQGGITLAIFTVALTAMFSNAQAATSFQTSQQENARASRLAAYSSAVTASVNVGAAYEIYGAGSADVKRALADWDVAYYSAVGFVAFQDDKNMFPALNRISQAVDSPPVPTRKTIRTAAVAFEIAVCKDLNPQSACDLYR